MLQVEESSLAIRVESGQIGERCSGVSKIELARRRGERNRGRRLISPEMRESVARCTTESGALRHSRVDADGIEERTGGAEIEQSVGPAIFVAGVGNG